MIALMTLAFHTNKFIYSQKIKFFKWSYTVSAVPIIPTDTDYSNNRPDYAYGRCIGTALPWWKLSEKLSINQMCEFILSDIW